MKFWIGVVVTVALATGLALSGTNEYFFYAGFVVLQFVVLATAWNILGGYAGYVNFGTAAFFGIGAYTAVVLFKAALAPLALQILAAAAISGLLGFGTGLLTLRLRGIFFSIATVAVIFIMETAMVNWRYVGGATGMQLLRPPVMEPFESYTRMLFVAMAILALIAVSIARYIEVSWIGRGLRAIRDSEDFIARFVARCRAARRSAACARLSHQILDPGCEASASIARPRWAMRPRRRASSTPSSRPR